MLLTSSKTLSILALLGSVSAAATKFKRDTESVILYSYGGETNGAPVYYDDGKIDDSLVSRYV
jgi:hypothetical protein